MTAETKVVELPDQIDFASPLRGADGKPVMENYFEDEDEKRGQWLQNKHQLVGRLSPEEAEELLSLRRQRPKALGRFCAEALFYMAQDDKADAMLRLRRGSLARKLQPNDDGLWPALRLSKKQRKMILASGEKIWPPLIATEVFVALEGEQALADEVAEGE